MTRSDRPALGPARASIATAALALLFLSVALVNGFPLYYPDSGGYAGRLQSLSSLRSAVPGLVAAPLYYLVDVWALPLVNSLALSVVVVRFCTVYLGRIPLAAIAVLSGAAAIPFFTSLILPDIWIVILLAALLLLLARWNVVDLVIAAVATAGHGSNMLILVLLAPVAVAVWPARLHALAVFVACGVAASVTLGAANLLVTGRLASEQYSWSILASKLLHAVPETVDDLCDSEPLAPLCARRAMLVAEPQSISDSYYLWNGDLGKPERGGLSRAEFNDTGRRLLRFAVLRHPARLARATLEDWADAYRRNQCLSMSGYFKKSQVGEYLHFIVDRDVGRVVPRGWLTAPAFCRPLYFVTKGLIVVALVASVLAFRRMGLRERAALLLLWAAVVSNDLVFALMTEPNGRYQLRIAGAFALIVLLASASATPRRVSAPRSAAPASPGRRAAPRGRPRSGAGAGPAPPGDGRPRARPA